MNILPCPVCGGKDLYSGALSAISYGVQCNSCRLKMDVDIPFTWNPDNGDYRAYTLNKAIDRWNGTREIDNYIIQVIIGNLERETCHWSCDEINFDNTEENRKMTMVIEGLDDDTQLEPYLYDGYLVLSLGSIITYIKEKLPCLTHI